MMPRRDRRGARLGALVALALGAASCSTRVPVDLATAPAACVVARGEGFVLTLGDSETLRLSQGPALTREEGTQSTTCPARSASPAAGASLLSLLW